MEKTMTPPSASSTAQSAVAMRVRFLPTAPAGVRVVARFADPSPAVAVVEPIGVVEALGAASTDDLYIILAPSADATSSAALNWIDSSKSPGAPLPVSVGLGKTQISWRPGRMLVEGRSSLTDQLLGAVCEFAFYEMQLRQLESAITPHEATAAVDAKYAYEIHSADKEARAHFGRTMQALAMLRLTFARLEPHLSIPSRLFSPAARKVFVRLCRRSLTEDRLEAATDRLEACEDLYEGAVDRMTDHRWYRRGSLLEIAIIALLLIEVVQLCAEMFLRAGR